MARHNSNSRDPHTVTPRPGPRGRTHVLTVQYSTYSSSRTVGCLSLVVDGPSPSGRSADHRNEKNARRDRPSSVINRPLRLVGTLNIGPSLGRGSRGQYGVSATIILQYTSVRHAKRQVRYASLPPPPTASWPPMATRMKTVLRGRAARSTRRPSRRTIFSTWKPLSSRARRIASPSSSRPLSFRPRPWSESFRRWTRSTRTTRTRTLGGSFRYGRVL